MGIKEVDFGLDNFKDPKTLSIKDSIVQILLNLFLMRPGNLPSLPHIGINIREYLYTMDTGFDVEELKKKIYSQATEVLQYVSLGDVQIFSAPYQGEQVLVIMIPVSGLSDEDETIVMAFMQDENSSELSYNYQFKDISIIN